MKKTVLVAAAAFAALAVGAPASAALIPGTPCATTNISPTAAACAGFYQGQILSNNAADLADQATALATLGFVFNTSTFNSLEKISGLGGNTTVNFTTPLSGITYVGLHFGNGQGGPGNATAFYRFNAGTNLDTFLLNLNASSDAVLYSTGTPPAVPEPATWAMMIGGFGAIGIAARRRRQIAHVSFS